MLVTSASMFREHGEPSCCEGDNKMPMEDAALVAQVSVNSN